MGLEVLERGDNLDSADKECLLNMKEASSFMSNTLNDVLSMQKIEEGKMELDLDTFSIADTIARVISIMSASIISKNIISNLLSNAIKFSDQENSIMIKVTRDIVSESSYTNDTVLLTTSVINEGPGISKENQLKLFNSFVQINPNTLQNGQGSGLGLSLCKQIVMLHGGDITVKSEVGIGSTFSFTIPFKKYHSASISNTSPIEIRIPNDTEVISIPPILIVDGKYTLFISHIY